MAGLKFRQWQNEKHPPTPASLTGLVSAGAYRTPMLRRGISWLKFKSVRPVATVLAELMVPALEQIRPLEQLRKGAVLTPLPLHPQRLAQRGFNQAEALVAELNQLTDIPQIHLLTRQRSTFKQTKLPSRLRKQNVSNAFSATLVTDDQHPVIIIIDDVSTTGSTLAEAARTLREAGVSSQIYGATIARG